jgi:flagellin
MSIVINTNTQSIFAQRALNRNTLDLQRNIEHLSTGFKINRAADDAAGLSISNKLTTKIRGFEKAKQNAGDGISLIQTAEGALGIVQENLQRIRELVVQGVNGTFSSNELDAFQREINERIRVIDDISQSTEFNGISVLSGNNTIANPYPVGVTTYDVILQTGADSGQTTRLSFESGNTANTGININVDHEITGTTVDFGEMNEGIGAVGFALSELHLQGATVDSLAVAETRFAGAANVDIGIAGIPIGLGDIDTVIDNVSRMRSELGAMQNALESKMTYLDIARENAEASRSRIRDVDVAKESSMLVKNQILQQSASAMLAQANTSPQLALQLLQQ